MSRHVALLGDSILVNRAYTGDEPADYANPIEPSGRGGRKIAEAIARRTGARGDGSNYSRVFAG